MHLLTIRSEVTESKLEADQYENSTVSGTNVASSGGVADDDDDDEPSGGKQQKERRKIEIKFIQDKSRRHITFSKRKAGIMKKAYELSVLTGTQVLLLVVSETGLVYTFTTPKLQPLVTKSEGKNLIQACLNAPEEGLGDDQDNQSDGNSQESPDHSPVPNANIQSQPQQPPQPHRPIQHQQVQMEQQRQQAQQLPPGAHIPHGMPFPQGNHPQQAMQMPPNYGDAQAYQQYFSNMQNGNMPNQQQYQ
jgi:MADS-box transcription factor